MLTISDNGINLIKSFEGLSLFAYKCLPTEKYWTIGYGHYGTDVKSDSVITMERAIELLRSDLKKYENRVNQFDSIYHFNQNEFDALVSFCYNVGSINQLTNGGKRSRQEIADKMLSYVKSGGNVVRGLVKRREKERTLFLTPNKYNNQVEYYAQLVIKGYFGNGAERKRRIPQETPYTYTQIQTRVNQILRGV